MSTSNEQMSGIRRVKSAKKIVPIEKPIFKVMQQSDNNYIPRTADDIDNGAKSLPNSIGIDGTINSTSTYIPTTTNQETSKKSLLSSQDENKQSKLVKNQNFQNNKAYDNTIYQFTSELQSESLNYQLNPNQIIDPRFIIIVTQRRNPETQEIENIEKVQLRDGIKMTPELQEIQKQIENGTYREKFLKQQQRSKPHKREFKHDIVYNSSDNNNNNNSKIRKTRSFERLNNKSSSSSDDNFYVSKKEPQNPDFDILDEYQEASSEDNDSYDNPQTNHPKKWVKYTTQKKRKYNKETNQFEEYYSNDAEYTSQSQKPSDVEPYPPLYKPRKPYRSPSSPQKNVPRKPSQPAEIYDGPMEIPSDRAFIATYGSMKPPLKEYYQEIPIRPRHYKDKGDDYFPDVMLQPKGPHLIKIDKKYFIERVENGFITRYRSTEDGKRIVLISKGNENNKQKSPKRKDSNEKEKDNTENEKQKGNNENGNKKQEDKKKDRENEGKKESQKRTKPSKDEKKDSSSYSSSSSYS